MIIFKRLGKKVCYPDTYMKTSRWCGQIKIKQRKRKEKPTYQLKLKMQTVDLTCTLSNLSIKYHQQSRITESKIEKSKWNEKIMRLWKTKLAQF